MRVTSGIKKGAILHTINDLSIRPTSDKVKQSIFNIIQFKIQDTIVLDLFAGSGALGIEAISRGAYSATFVDTDTKIVLKNIEKVDFKDKSHIVKSDFTSYLDSCCKNFSLVFLDPPYNKGFLDIALKMLINKNLLLNNALIVMECDIGEIIKIPKEINVIKEASYGRIKIIIGQKG